MSGAPAWLKRLVTVKPIEAPVSIGLDIGSSAIKAVALARRKGTGPRPVVGHKMVPLPDRADQAASAIKTAIEGLSVPLGSTAVSVSVSGPSVIMRVVEMPTMNPVELKKALPFEAQRYLPFPVQDVMLDGELLGSIDAKKSWVLVVACKKDVIDGRLSLIKQAGLEPTFIDVDALALTNSFLDRLPDQRPGATIALMNLGAQVTSIVIFKGATPYLVRDIPWGSERLIKDLAQQAGKETAEIKQSLAQAESANELLDSLKVVCESLLVELQLSFDYFENQFGQPPESVWVTGGLSQSKLFAESLKLQLTQVVNAWNPHADLPGQFSVAYGLALRG